MRFKVSELVDFNSENIRKNDELGEIYYLDTANLTEGVFDEIKVYNWKEDKVPSRARRKVNKNDILISTVRPNQKHYGFITEKEQEYIVSTGFAVLTSNTDKVDPYYLYQYLTLDKTTDYLQMIAEDSTSAYPSVKPKDIGNLEIELPELNIQNKIGNFLWDINKKIHLNTSIINNLEDLAQTLFKRWFVDFEFPNEEGKPYRSSGGKMVDSELGMIPEGWEVGELNHLVEFKKDSVKKGEHNDHKKYVPIELLPMRKMTFTDYNPGTDANSSLIEFKENDILLGSMRVYFHRVCLAPFDGLTRTTCFVLRPYKSNYRYYILLTVFQDETIGYANATSKGTTIPYATWDNGLSKLKTIIPKENVLNEFNNKLEPLFFKMKALSIECRTLENLRETLLPKLLSGEIELPADMEVTDDVPIS